VLPPVRVTSTTGHTADDLDDDPPGRPARIAVVVATVATILPVWVAAFRVGVRHLVPVGDTAIMALRAPDVLSAHPPLIGMPASSASGVEHIVHFPGAWQLYWLALPVKVLGSTWGTVVAMGALNTIWIVLIIWLLCRNLDPPTALWSIACVGAFTWSIGAGMLIDSWPLKMVLVPFLCVAVAAWCTAVGDRVALVVLAVAANYAWLDHLVLALVVPSVALIGCAGFVASHLRANRADPAGRTDRRRRFTRAVGLAGAVTFVMWLPAIVQQVTHSPGNLRLLVTGAEGGPAPIHSMSSAVHVVASLIGRPPFWLRGTLEDPTFYRAHLTGFAGGSTTWFDLVVAVGGVVVFGVLTVLAVGARDRVGLALLAISTTATLGSIATIYLAPVTTAVVPEYLYSVWVTAVLAWLAVLVNVIRRTGIAAAPATAFGALGVAVVFGVLNLPTSHTGYTFRPEENTIAGQASAAVIAHLDGTEPVAVTLENTFTQNADYLSALLVALRDHGIAFCYPTPNTSLYDFIPDCGTTPAAKPRTTIVLADKAASEPPAGTVVFRTPIFPRQPDGRAAALDRRIGRWLQTRSSLQLTDAARRPFLGPMIPSLLQDQVDGFEPRHGNLGHLVDDPAFQRMIITWWQRADARNAPLFTAQPVSPAELYQWALGRHRAGLVLWVTEQPAR
jgi:hypothetical protein